MRKKKDDEKLEPQEKEIEPEEDDAFDASVIAQMRRRAGLGAI